MPHHENHLHQVLLPRSQHDYSSHLRIYVTGYILLGITVLAIASMGLAWCYTADYFHHHGQYPTGWVGYNVLNFMGLLLFVVFSLCAITLLYVGVSMLMHLWKDITGLVPFATLGVMFICMGILGIAWGGETMRCLGIFCINNQKYIEIPGERPEAGLGFLSVIGMSAFFLLVPMGLVMLVQVILRVLKIERLFPVSSCWHPTIRRKLVLAFAAVSFVLIALWALITFYLPNSWEYVTASRIAQYAQVRITHDYQLCQTDSAHFTCPELPWSFFFTHQWEWSEMLVLKLYPSNIFFFSYLLIMLLLISAIRATRTGRLLMKRRCPLLRRFTYGEACFVLLTAAMLLLFFLYWVQGHNFRGLWTGGESDVILLSEKVARSLGQLAVAFLSLCIFPASRYSVLHSILGTSWESSIWVHKLLGYGMLFASFAHMIGWYFYYWEVGTFPGDIFSIPMKSKINVDNFTVPLISLVSWFMFVAMGLFALEPVRRRFFELFYYMHIVAFYMIAPTVIWHASAAWEYFLPGLTVWFIDRLLRMYRSGSKVEILSALAMGSFVELRFRGAAVSGAPGQYAFVNIPELSIMEWHPLSFSTVCEGCYTFHIRSMGKGTWSGRLLNLVNERGTDFTLCVDGPCGRVQDFEDYRTIVLVAGGIGVTPCSAIYSYFCRQTLVPEDRPDVALLWTLRDAELMQMMMKLWKGMKEVELYDAERSVSSCELPGLQIHFTGTDGDVFEKLNVPVEMTRPDLETTIPKLIANKDPRSVLLFACGPTRLVRSARDVALSLGVNFHEECFLL